MPNALIKPFILLVLSALVNLLLCSCADATAIADDDASKAAIMARLSPDGSVDIEGQAKVIALSDTDSARPERGGSEIYQRTCVLCHGSGVAGAPLFANAQAWAPRKAKGMAVLLNHALLGFNYMPPRGSCTDCSDSEIKEAIRYMLSKANQ